MNTTHSSLAGKALLITGANRGIGEALVAEALNRDAARVYAASRQPFDPADSRVVPVLLDVTKPEQVQRAAQEFDQLDVLVNNAGVALFDDLSDRAALQESLEVNLFGPFELCRALTPKLIESRGAIINIGSIAAWAAIPVMPAYSVSKAAAFVFSQALRARLDGAGVRVHAAMLGPVDTDMTRGLEIPKASPASVASGIFDGYERGDEEIFPDPMSSTMAESWYAGAAKALERQNAAMVAG